ncbi:putative anti-sigma regulatory factor, serine/threonine protein kinase [Thalassoporum mexicanum PCC 7367]|uniref:ATP-binding protein n=1 Tax=Thalassoporum mexicanum TaxID=3457544 RepID=UPI00029FEADB|nr:anti-sigma regulatory factor [Pseudanabaena sp. PCC 7367]AFY70361.1 putative anti-sigma regulatory factor, serine/threonine protein kinase [Pseudanabaena sp. PCC 7367]
MEKQSEPSQARLRVETDIYALSKVQGWFNQFKPRMSNKVWMQCNLALTEGFTNVVCHAHERLPDHTPIDIEVELGADYLVMQIWDYGAPFDLMAKLATLANTEESLDDIDNLPTGGRGLMITDAIADELSYDRLTDGRNCLRIKKNLFPPE